MNYAAVILAATAIFSIVYWYLGGRYVLFACLMPWPNTHNHFICTKAHTTISCPPFASPQPRFISPSHHSQTPKHKSHELTLPTRTSRFYVGPRVHAKLVDETEDGGLEMR